MHSSISTTASCGMLSISVNDLQTTAFGTWRDGAAIRCFFFGDTPTSAMAISDSQNENCNTSCTKTLHTCTFAACAGISNQLASSRSLIACNPSWTILLYLAISFSLCSGTRPLKNTSQKMCRHPHPCNTSSWIRSTPLLRLTSCYKKMLGSCMCCCFQASACNKSMELKSAHGNETNQWT